MKNTDKENLEEIRKTIQFSKQRKQEGDIEKKMVIIPAYASDLKKRGRKREKWEIYV